MKTLTTEDCTDVFFRGDIIIIKSEIIVNRRENISSTFNMQCALYRKYVYSNKSSHASTNDNHFILIEIAERFKNGDFLRVDENYHNFIFILIWNKFEQENKKD